MFTKFIYYAGVSIELGDECSMYGLGYSIFGFLGFSVVIIGDIFYTFHLF